MPKDSWDSETFLSRKANRFLSPAKTVPKELDSGSYEQRLCYVIMVNEIEGSDKALEYLEKLEQKVESNSLELTESQKKMRDALSSMMQGIRGWKFRTRSRSRGSGID